MSSRCHYCPRTPHLSPFVWLTPSHTFFFFFNYTATPEIYPLSLHDALPIFFSSSAPLPATPPNPSTSRAQLACSRASFIFRSEEHTSELQSQSNLVCRLLLEKKKNTYACASHYLHPYRPLRHSRIHLPPSRY